MGARNDKNDGRVDAPATSYWDFIRVDDLLGLQGGLERDEAQLDNEEVLFITVHQVFELWFKLVLRELVGARDLFTAPHVAEQELSGAARGVRRATTIFRVAAHHFEVVETLGTREYLAFRNKLMPASGFQSAQMRRIEILLGLEESDRIALGSEGSHLDALREEDGSKSPAFLAVEAQLEDRPTLKEAIEGLAPAGADRRRAPRRAGRGGAAPALHRPLPRRARGRGGREPSAGADARLDRGGARAARGDVPRRGRTRCAPTSSPARTRAACAAHGSARRSCSSTPTASCPLLAWPREVLAALIELEQAFLIFRQRHARMVERVIGRRTGTGGSAGVDYLDKTALQYRIFRDLWGDAHDPRPAGRGAGPRERGLLRVPGGALAPPPHHAGVSSFWSVCSNERP